MTCQIYPQFKSLICQVSHFILDLYLMNPCNEEHVCHCGHVFTQSGHLICHQRTCQATKMLLLGALVKAKGFLKAKKWQCLENPGTNVVSSLDVSNPALWYWAHIVTLPSWSVGNPGGQLGVNMDDVHVANISLEGQSSPPSHTQVVLF